MRKHIRPDNSLITLAVMVLVGWFAACGPAAAQHEKDLMMTHSRMTLWRTIDSLVQHIPLTTAKVESVLVTQLVERDTSKNLFRDTASHFYIGGPVRLSDGVVVGKVDLRVRRTPGHPGFLVLDELDGTCITLKAVRAHYQSLTVTEYPKGQSLDEALGYTAFQEWGKLSFGFVERKPDCLGYVAFEPNNG